MQIGAVALEEGVSAHRQKNIKIPGRPAARARLALPGEPDAGAVLDPGRNIDRQGAFALHPARAGAGRTGIVDHLAAPMACRAGAPHAKEATVLADLAVAGAGRAG